jgi:hypothetical protein
LSNPTADPKTGDLSAATKLALEEEVALLLRRIGEASGQK